MEEYISVCESGLNLVFSVNENQTLSLLHCSARPFDPRELENADTAEFRAAEVTVTGENRPEDRLGSQMIHSLPGGRLQYQWRSDTRNRYGRKLELVTRDEETGLEVTLHYQFFSGIPAMRCWSEVSNTGDSAQGLECVTSFSLHGLEKSGKLPYEKKLRLHVFHNGWQKELAYRSYSLPELGLSRSQAVGKSNSSKTISFSNTGSWSSKEFIPMGILQNTESGEWLCWQIEHNGSWHWEIGEHAGALYLKAAGPTQEQSDWWRSLKPGETFISVPVAVVASVGGQDELMAELTRYRRVMRRRNRDDEETPVIFNDYMNCLWGSPTTEKELPLIEAAAKNGCEIYCMDCGWYSDGPWWDSVGEWQPSRARFPDGLREVAKEVSGKGMTFGLWLEPEVMGIHCRKSNEVPQDWFFQRHGLPLKDKSRYQLDFRNPMVSAYLRGVVDRLVGKYGAGYLKLDYNIEPGAGTDLHADSPGDGLLQHNRAYLAWLDSLFASYPGLVIENCSSGGMRMDYALLSRCSLQSTSDTEDCVAYSTIAANAPAAVTPEQAAVWSYPLCSDGAERTAFNMVNAMLLRIHLSGTLNLLPKECASLVQEGIRYYRDTRADRRGGIPFWPLGFAHYEDPWAALGMVGNTKAYLAVWRRGGLEDTVELPLRLLKGKEIRWRCAYPAQLGQTAEWDADAGIFRVTLASPQSARLFEFTLPDGLNSATFPHSHTEH